MKPLAIAVAISALMRPAYANEYRSAMEAYLEAEISAWIDNPVLVAAIKSQNSETANLPQSEIDRLDQIWRAEVGSDSSQLINSVLENEAANFLRQRMDEAGGAISEIFAMDARGLNVAASSATSDYWQGDEAKFQESYGLGAGSVHFGEIEFDESSQTYQGQISLVIVDPESETPIGAMTIGVNAEALL